MAKIKQSQSKKKLSGRLKSYGLENVDNYESEQTLWTPEHQAWIQATTLKGLFSTEDWVFICVDLIAREISNLPRYVYRKIAVGNETKFEIANNHPLQSLLDSPNNFMDQPTFRYLETLEHTLMGNIVIWYARFNKTMVILPTESVQLDFDKCEKPIYRYLPNGYDTCGVVNQLVTMSFDDIMHVKRPNPQSGFWGLSPFVPARKCVLFNRYSTDYLNSFYLKGATPAMAMTMDKDASEQSVTRLLKSFEMAHTGRRNQRRTMLLPKGVDIKTLGISVADQSLIDTVMMNRETILNILHVPKHAVSLQTTGSLGSEEHSRALKYFWQSTLLPIDTQINAAYNKFFKNELGPNFVIKSDITNIPLLQEDEKTKADLGSALLQTHTVNEVRAKLYQLPAIPGGDIIVSLAKLSQPTPIVPQQNTTANPQALAQTMQLESIVDEKKNSCVEKEILTLPNAVRSEIIKNRKYVHDNANVVKLIDSILNAKTVDEKVILVISKFLSENIKHMYNVKDDGELSEVALICRAFGGAIGAKWFVDTAKKISQTETTIEDDESLKELHFSFSDNIGSNKSEELIAYITDKYKAYKSFEALNEEENVAQDKIHELSVSTFEKMFKASIDVLKTTSKKEFNEPEDISNEEIERRELPRIKRELQKAQATLAKEWSDEYEKNLQATVNLGYDSQLNLEFLAPAKDAIEALKKRDAQKRREILQARGLESFTNISKTTTDRIMKTVTNGLENNLSITEIGRNIASDFREITPARAETIARTETLTASSLGQAAAMENAKEVVPDLKKIWINANDMLVRGRPGGKYADAEFDHWHVQNDGPIDADATFSNGLKFPREPGGEAGNVINCRCTMMVIAKEDLEYIKPTAKPKP